MSSSNSRKKNTRFYWAELGFVGLGLLGLNPNLIGDILGGNSDSAKAVRDVAQVLAKDALKHTQELTGHFAQATTQPAYAYHPAYAQPAYQQSGYSQNTGYMPSPIVYGNQIYYPQNGYQPQQSYYNQAQQPYNHYESASQFANFLSDFARRMAFDPSSQQQNSTSQYPSQQQYPVSTGQQYPYNGQQNYGQPNYGQQNNTWGSIQQDDTRYAKENTVPPNDYPSTSDHSYVAQMPNPTSNRLSTNMVQGYASNYPSASNEGTTNTTPQWGTPQATGNAANIPSTSSYTQQWNNNSASQSYLPHAGVNQNNPVSNRATNYRGPSDLNATQPYSGYASQSSQQRAANSQLNQNTLQPQSTRNNVAYPPANSSNYQPNSGIYR